MSEGKKSADAPDLDAYFEPFEPNRYRSLPGSATADRPRSTDILDEEPVYRDLPVPDFASTSGVPAFVPATFDVDEAGPVYRSLPALPAMGGAQEVGGLPCSTDVPQYRGIGMFDDAAYMTRTTPDVESRRAAHVTVPSVGSAAKNEPLPSPPPVPNPPFRLEKSHFVGKGDTDAMVSGLDMAFAQMQVDVTFKKKKFKFKCIAHPGYERVDFKVCLFTRGTNGDVVVEFQRRRGGALHFNSIFCGVRECLRKQQLVIGTRTEVVTAPQMGGAFCPPSLSMQDNVPLPASRPNGLKDCFAPPALPANRDVQSNDGDTIQNNTQGREDGCGNRSDGVETLLNMAAADADGGEVARQAAGAVAVLSNTSDGVASFANDGVLQRLSSLLAAKDPCVQRCAAVALANVCERMPEMHEAVVAARTLRPLVALVQNANTQPLGTSGPDPRVECVRHAVRALASISSSHGDAVEEVGGVEVLEAVARTNQDAFVRSYTSEVMAAVAGKMSAGMGPALRVA